MQSVVIVTDAWKPQHNGVVRNYENLTRLLEARGTRVTIISPLDFTTVPCPTYPEIPLSLFPAKKLGRLIDAAGPDAVHIATEGPLGWAARRLCQKRGWPFSTAYHTKFPEYVAQRFALPVGVTYNLLRRFHGKAGATMVTTEPLKQELVARRFDHLQIRRMGVDTNVFKPNADKSFLNHLPRPIFVCHGRVAVEKSLENFLKLDLPGTKLVIGEGPMLAKLKKDFPHAHFTGYLDDAPMAKHLAACDVFVFPSVTETFGLVMLEALACGLPVAATPSTGPNEIVGTSGAGVLDSDLAKAAKACLGIDPALCVARAKTFKWEDGVADFTAALQPIKKTAA